jgi:hypothetical protein
MIPKLAAMGCKHQLEKKHIWMMCHACQILGNSGASRFVRLLHFELLEESDEHRGELFQLLELCHTW